MHPVICQLGPFTVYSYGLMMAIAVIVCAWLAARDAKTLRLSSDVIFDLVFWIMLSGIVGARIFFVILEWKFFAGHPIEVLMLQKGGLAWQGGLLGGIFAGISYVRWKKLPLWPVVDLAAPYIALGHAIGRIGCFLNGCCYGREVSWGMFFPIQQAHLHPTQLYESASLLAIFFILKKIRNVSRIPGQTFAWYLILASLERFVVEFFRADHTTTPWGLSVFQWVTVVMAAAGIGLHIFFSRIKPWPRNN